MARAIQTSFSAGALSPRLFGRMDLEKYYQGASELLNMVVLPHGGIERRPGSRFVTERPDPSGGGTLDQVRLIGFTFSNTQTYMLELGPGDIGGSTDTYLRVYRDGGAIQSTDSVSAATRVIFDGGPLYTVTMTTAAAHNLALGTDAVVANVNEAGYNGTHEVLSIISTTQFTYRVTGDPGAYTGGGDIANDHFFSTPYAEGELAELRWTQSADVLFIDHPDVKPQELVRNADTDWEFVDHDFQNGPYDAFNTTAADPVPTTLTSVPATTGAGRAVTASATTGINNDEGFKSTDVGRHILMATGGTCGWGFITAFTDTTHVTVTVVNAYPAGAQTAWRLGAWSDTDGWPWTLAFHQGRLWHGGRGGAPQTVWGSVPNDFTNHRPHQPDLSVNDDDAITRTISDDQVNPIYWMTSVDKGMIVHTSGGEFLLNSSGTSRVITPSSVEIKRQSEFGVRKLVQPVKAGNAILFAQTAGKTVRELAYSFDPDQFVAVDLTILAENLLDGVIRRMVFVREPYPILWCLLEDGTLSAMTYDRNENVIAWHHHMIAGSSSVADAKVRDIASIREDGYDQLWMAVDRGLDPGAGLPDVFEDGYVEFLTKPLSSSDDPIEDATYGDSNVSLSPLWNTDTDDTLELEVYGGAGSGFDQDEFGKLTAVDHTPFTGDPVGDIYHFRLATSTNFVSVRAKVVQRDSDAVAKVLWLLNGVPAALQNQAVSTWSKAALSLTGLDHLNGQVPGLWVDGFDRGSSRVVSGGNRDVSEYGATTACVGRYYPSRGSTMPLVIRSAAGISSGLKARPYRLFAWIYRTGLPNIFPSPDEIHPLTASEKGSDDIEQVTPRSWDNLEPDEPNVVFTGTVDLGIIVPFGKQPMVSIFMAEPSMAPMTILHIGTEADVGDV